jgi:hypothetical protein
MVKSFEGGSALIEQWLKNKDTVLFLGVWEQIYNPAFNSLEFEGIRNEAGRNSFYLSAKKWIEATGAIGLHAKAGRYGGTYAHRDIAFEFGYWLSPEFKLYLIKEFQRLKDEEARDIAGMELPAHTGKNQLPHPHGRDQGTADSTATHQGANRHRVRQRDRLAQHGPIRHDCRAMASG